MWTHNKENSQMTKLTKGTQQGGDRTPNKEMTKFIKMHNTTRKQWSSQGAHNKNPTNNKVQQTKSNNYSMHYPHYKQ
jgi:hypothetical protein